MQTKQFEGTKNIVKESVIQEMHKTATNVYAACVTNKSLVKDRTGYEIEVYTPTDGSKVYGFLIVDLHSGRSNGLYMSENLNIQDASRFASEAASKLFKDQSVESQKKFLVTFAKTIVDALIQDMDNSSALWRMLYSSIETVYAV